MDAADHVVERVTRRWSQRRRDTEVVFETHAEAETFRHIDVAQHVVVILQFRRGEMLRDAMRTVAMSGPRPLLEGHGAVARENAMHVMIARAVRRCACRHRASASGAAAIGRCQASSASANSAPETTECPPRRTGTGAAAAASVKERSVGSTIAARSNT